MPAPHSQVFGKTPRHEAKATNSDIFPLSVEDMGLSHSSVALYAAIFQIKTQAQT